MATLHAPPRPSLVLKGDGSETRVLAAHSTAAVRVRLDAVQRPWHPTRRSGQMPGPGLSSRRPQAAMLGALAGWDRRILDSTGCAWRSKVKVTVGGLATWIRISGDLPPKPNCMRWTTYNALEARYDATEEFLRAGLLGGSGETKKRGVKLEISRPTAARARTNHESWRHLPALLSPMLNLVFTRPGYPLFLSRTCKYTSGDKWTFTDLRSPAGS